MFPLQPKVCLFIQKKQSSKENSIKSNNQKETTSKHQRKTTSIYLCTKQKIRKKKVPTLKNLQSNKLRGGLDYRHKISNHGLALLFLQLNPCLLSYIHPFQPEGVEGAQADS